MPATVARSRGTARQQRQSSFAEAADRQPPPNIVFILADDQGWNGLSSAWEGGIRVPLIIRGPGIAADSWCHLPVVGYDLLPQKT